MLNDIKITIPGEQIGVEEEFMPGNGVYIENGKIYSSKLGILIIDSKNKKINVESKTKLAIPEVGDIVEGIIVGPIREDSTIVEIVRILGKKNLKGTFTGILHISQITRGRLSTILNAIGLGDWILAKVMTSWPPYQLSILDNNLGIIYSTCPKCGKELVLKKGRLYCDKDKIFIKKKVSSQYLLKED
ncbi:MAG: exosome complex RNA-binding protein Csl4 [Candidatus Methanomethylicaceae archaeon]|nr:exosome complex RNA-binding protein Csl4 [Candidatus Verstraetearchaeota archaeon]